MSATGSAISAGSRVRPQGRKKALDDAAYFGPPTSTIGNKRQATEKADGDTSRVKRKKTDVVNMQNGFNNVYSKRDEVEPKAFLVEFGRLDSKSIFNYISQHDISPNIQPSPMTAEDPPPPSSLVNPGNRARPMTPPPPPSTAAANRPRRRSSRLVEDEIPVRTPILADVAEFRSVIAAIAEDHFRELMIMNGREELDTLASFMCLIEKERADRVR